MAQRFINDNVEHKFEFGELCTIVNSLEASVEKFKGSLKSLVASDDKYKMLSIGIVLGAIGKAAKLLDKLYITDPKKGDNEPYLKANFLEEDVDKIQELVTKHSHPELADREGGMVSQDWADGEVTSQKCGSLLGQRSLHQIEPGVEGLDIPGIVWPNKNFRDIGFIYTDDAGTKALREAMVVAYVNAILGEKVM
jgi:hypothetical protein